MTIIYYQNQSLKLEELEEEIKHICDILEEFDDQSGIGLLADLSIKSILLLIAAIRSGKRCALVPLREPPLVVDAWLKSLGITKLISSFRPRDDYLVTTKLYVISDLLLSNRSSVLKKPQTQFSSIVRSSGTGGVPKSALIEEKAHLASAKAVNDYFAFDNNSCWLLSLPLSHVSGLSIIFRMLLSRGNIFIAQDHNELVNALLSGKVTHCSLVPTQLLRLLDENVDLSYLKAVIIGGDRLMPNLCAQALKRSWPIFECYGMTETASMIVLRNFNKQNQVTILPHAEIIFGDDNEILVKSASLFAGYLNNGQLCCELNSDGFFATGDLGSKDLLNQFYVNGRKNNRIISGGENIQAEEIEAVLEEHPGVLEALVISEPDLKLGHRPVAYLKWRNQPEPISEIINFLNTRLARYKCPKVFLDWPHEIKDSMKKPRMWLSNYYKEQQVIPRS